jgi:beta-lactamase regulating signal transducer with metallopeptidase domain
MTDLLNILNKTGESFCDFSLAMLVQSCVLIVVLYAIDLLLRKHVRAVFRYCIWMLVFVKLVLPTTLSLPTGIGYWYGPDVSTPISEVQTPVPVETAAVEPIDQVHNVTVEVPAAPAISRNLDASGNAVKSAEYSRDYAEVPVQHIQTASVAAPVETVAITWQAVVFLIWLVGVLALSMLLFQRFLFVKSLLAQSEKASGRLDETLRKCCEQVGVKKNIELRLSKNMLSPAACGLSNPVILMPGALLETLSKEKLRAVLIHELAHIKRGDLWVNFLQTILQILYFYNPLLWLANAVVRGLREKAVDEMVLTKLGDAADSYSNTLIDIAEMYSSFESLLLSQLFISIYL